MGAAGGRAPASGGHVMKKLCGNFRDAGFWLWFARPKNRSPPMAVEPLSEQRFSMVRARTPFQTPSSPSGTGVSSLRARPTRSRSPRGQSVSTSPVRASSPGSSTYGHVSGVLGLEGGYYDEDNLLRQLDLYAGYGVTAVNSLGGEGEDAGLAGKVGLR